VQRITRAIPDAMRDSPSVLPSSVPRS